VVSARSYEEQEEYEREVKREVAAECRQEDRVARLITFRAFVSKSKGIRNGKRRVRKHWKEVYLVRYRSEGFRSWNRFPFDEAATEIIGQHADGEILKERVLELEKKC
jgi:hypothetical protein